MDIDTNCKTKMFPQATSKNDDELWTSSNRNVNEDWIYIHRRMHLASGCVCNPRSGVHEMNWISQESLGLIGENSFETVNAM